MRAQAASGHGGLADQPAARTPGEADDPRSRMVTLHALAREAAGGDRQEALGFARGALALLDVTEEEREVASLRPR